MSTLKVTEIQSNSTAFNTPVRFETSGGTENGQFVKAWVNFNGSGTVAIRADFNVNTISDRGSGQFTMNFSNSLTDANYCVSGAGNHTAVVVSFDEDTGGGGTAPTSSAFAFRMNFGGGPIDGNRNTVAIHR